MRNSSSALIVILLASAACDKEDAKPAPAASASAVAATTASTAPAASAAPAATADAGAGATDGGAGGSSLKMPERPIPKGQTMIGSAAPIEVQQKAIGYMVAMRAPRPDEAPADVAFATDLAEKLKPITLSLDSGGGAEKAKLDRVEVQASGRQIDLLMAGGCDAKTPVRAVVQRAGVQLATLVSRGVLVIRCNDARIQCLQSTRDPEDVLCTTAPRHK